MDDFQVAIFRECPSCGERGYEFLDTHSHCVLCNYSRTFFADEDEFNLIWATNYPKAIARAKKSENSHSGGSVTDSPEETI